MEAQSVVKRKYPGNSAWGCCFLKISQNNDLIVGAELILNGGKDEIVKIKSFDIKNPVGNILL